jgi:hypothetical protein
VAHLLNAQGYLNMGQTDKVRRIVSQTCRNTNAYTGTSSNKLHWSIRAIKKYEQIKIILIDVTILFYICMCYTLKYIYVCARIRIPLIVDSWDMEDPNRWYFLIQVCSLHNLHWEIIDINYFHGSPQTRQNQLNKCVSRLLCYYSFNIIIHGYAATFFQLSLSFVRKIK